jgi:hypothetical protein
VFDLKRILLIAILAVLIITSTGYAQTAQKSELWFDDIASPISLSTQDKQELMKTLGGCLLPKMKSSHDPFPDAVQNDNGGRIVFISLFDGKSTASVFRGEGLGLAKAIECALGRIPQKCRTTKWAAVKLDIVHAAIPLERTSNLINIHFNPGLDGIATLSKYSGALLPCEIIAKRCLYTSGSIRWTVFSRAMEPFGITIYTESTQSLDFLSLGYRFTTDSLYYNGKNVLPIYRGHIADMPVTQPNLMRSISAASDYLKNSVDKSGKFSYNYYPGEDSDGDGYNYVRHAGTIYSMCDAYSVTKDKDLLAAIRRSIDYLLQKKVSKGTTAYIKNRSDVTSLGVNALAALALAKYTTVTGDRKYVPTMLQLGRWMEKHQDKSGAFAHYIDLKTGKPTSAKCDYYPGEATFALVRIAQIDKKSHWLDTAEKAARYVERTRDAKLEDSRLPNDQWMLYALNELYRARPKPFYLAYARRLANAEMLSQTKDSPFPDEIGRLRGKLQSNITAVEGLTAACMLLKDHGTKGEAGKIRNSLEAAVRYQMQLQYMSESSIYLANPLRAIGGVPKGYGNNIIRIDTVQHFLSGCISYLRIIKASK